MERTKGLFGIGSALLFVVLGFYLVFEKSKQVGVTNSLFIKISGVVCILFFGFLALKGLIKLFKK